eukprot:CAMPEP_0204049002 /NCGR_PEP_ID=MMETSP0360-20130528/117257_1 /ASSEMBLY_ACC=CAM_ASM_000342 /TAXON_ID=268821 /ORGANISM="Scrippsiella Hangoei, Strain SHTV-5" /LENGTH=68 /DNA_ID=CAMNT_0050995851 /DNA_START=44 /DNA_END=247 /DNA_ORIENTATION=+
MAAWTRTESSPSSKKEPSSSLPARRRLGTLLGPSEGLLAGEPSGASSTPIIAPPHPGSAGRGIGDIMA